MSEGKTLRELNVQVGDVVRVASTPIGPVHDGAVWVIRGFDGCHYNGAHRTWPDDHKSVPLSASYGFIIVSRATPAPLPHGHVRLASGEVVHLTANRIAHGLLMAGDARDREIAAAMVAHGGPYQLLDRNGDWRDCKIAFREGFLGGYTYRVRPAPVVQTPREFWLYRGVETSWGVSSQKPTSSWDQVIHVREVIGDAA